MMRKGTSPEISAELLDESQVMEKILIVVRHVSSVSATNKARVSMKESPTVICFHIK
jgi:hypothetical protein